LSKHLQLAQIGKASMRSWSNSFIVGERMRGARGRIAHKSMSWT